MVRIGDATIVVPPEERAAALSDGPTVLIADDEPSLRLLVGATLESDDFTVLEARDGNEAWDLIQAYRPAVALLDVAMPGLSGLEVSRLIKRDPRLAGTCVIMLTSRVTQADALRGLAAGASLYLTKPFVPLELVNAVERALHLD